jgi:hypothetical protein
VFTAADDAPVLGVARRTKDDSAVVMSSDPPNGAARRRERFLATAGRLADAGLTLGGTLAFGVFLRFLYQDLSGQRHLVTAFQITAAYVVPGVVAILCFVSLRLRPIQRISFLMSSAALVVSVYAAELVLVATRNTPLRPVMLLLQDSRDKRKDAQALARRFGLEIDSRNATEVIADLQRQGIDAVPIVTSTNHLFVDRPDGGIESAIRVDGHEVVPLGSVSKRVTLLCNENGQWVYYRSDGWGFNNPDDAWKSGGVAVAAIGDSFAHGYCVPPDRNFVALIRRGENATLNLGMAGHGPLAMLATLTEYLPPLAPPVVLWFYCEGNDLTDLRRERQSPVLVRYLEDGFAQPALSRQGSIDWAIENEMPRIRAEAEERARRRAVYGPRHRTLAFVKLTAFRETLGLVDGMAFSDVAVAADLEARNMEVFREVLRRARARVDRWNGQLYFVYLPEWSSYAGIESWGTASRNAVLGLVADLGIALIDIDPVFRAHGDPLDLFPFRAVGHYNEAGHRLVAEEVLRRLPSRRLSQLE